MEQLFLQFRLVATAFFISRESTAARTEAKALPVEFMQYWPTYDVMSPAQQQWYFYWRSEVRQGRLLATDLSYIFVHVYELINLIGV